MTHQFFEGAAGTGKTYKLMESLGGLLLSRPLQPYQNILALTYMHGSRARLDAKLSDVPNLKKAYHCTTFDAFANGITTRWKALLKKVKANTRTEALEDSFEQQCLDAALLLEYSEVRAWVSKKYPIIIVDEAQDLSNPRFRMMRELSKNSLLLSAADEFQYLGNNDNSLETVDWLRANSTQNALTAIRRTAVQGLLDVGLALREGRGMLPLLTFRSGRYVANGFMLCACPAIPLISWRTAHALYENSGETVAILTVSPRDRNALAIIERVRTVTNNLSKNSNIRFGPYPDLSVELDRKAAVNQALEEMAVANDPITPVDLLSSLRNVSDQRMADELRAQLRREIRLGYYRERSSDQLKQLLDECLRRRRIYGVRKERKQQALSIHQAKNREFDHVVVLWTFALPNDEEQLRRLLYNAITRAKKSCTVLILGNGSRLRQAPFIDAMPEDHQVQTH